MADLSKLREAVKKKAGIADRQLSRLVARKQEETFLPREVALMALAVDHGVSITRYASDDDLEKLRGITQAKTQPTPAPITPTPTPRSRSRAQSKPASPPRPAKPTRGRKVFVVHGRDKRLKDDLFDFLNSIGLEPIEWRKAIKLTGVASPTIAQILDAAFANAIAVVVLLTPDDTARLKPEFHSRSDPAYEKKFVGQSRPNVLFEAGIAFGRFLESTVLVQVGEVKPFSDIGGFHVTHLNNSPESRSEFVTKLGNAGCSTDTDGDRWYSVGDFQILDPKEVPK